MTVSTVDKLQRKVQLLPRPQSAPGQPEEETELLLSSREEEEQVLELTYAAAGEGAYCVFFLSFVCGEGLGGEDLGSSASGRNIWKSEKKAEKNESGEDSTHCEVAI